MGEQTEREAGFAAGILEQRLNQYDRHFAAINGSVADTAAALARLERTVDRLANEQMTAKSLADAVAAALEKRQSEEDAGELGRREIIAWALGLVATTLAAALGVRNLLGL